MSEAAAVKCPDCGLEYTQGAPHNMFCPAKTCTECGTTYRHAIDVYDADKLDDDGNPERLCDDCIENMFLDDDDDSILNALDEDDI